MALPTSGALTLANIQTEFGGTNPIALGEYYAGGGLVPAGTSGTYGAVPSSGALSVQNFYGTTAFTPIYIEDVFSTYLYTGTATIDTEIVNGINLRDYGGLVWIKKRNAVSNHSLFDSARGYDGTNDNRIYTNSTSAQVTGACDWAGVPSYVDYGFVLNGNGTSDRVNESGVPYTSWTFRKQPKFFDVVTYTGTGSAQTIAQNLGSVPGCVITKATSGASSWYVYHRSMTSANYYMRLNLTDAQAAASTVWNNTAPTSTVFSVGSDSGVNAAGVTYVAYLFAHDAGGFGLTGTDNVISCGSYTGNGSSTGPTITLGYEPQWLMIKNASTTGNWLMFDNMRGVATGGDDQALIANLSNAEANPGNVIDFTSTGFKVNVDYAQYNGNGNTILYIAIRRGPMKVPTSGTSVFSPVARTGTSATATVTGVGFPPDLFIVKGRSSGTEGATRDRLRGTNPALRTTTTNAESSTTTNGLLSYDMDGVTLGADNTGTDVNGQTNASPYTYANWFFRRAPSFFDEVCYTGTGSARTINHNLGVVPELMITKQRSGTSQWNIYQANLGASAFVQFTTAAVTTGDSTRWNSTAPTSSVFSLGTSASLNSSGQTYVWYGFATCAGVSKVGSYTGTGASGNAITTGFSPRFLMIKCTSTTGNWIVFDTARGMGAGSEPYLLLNTTGTETAGTDWLDVSSSGFSLNTTGNATNGSGQTYIYLAIA